jgi:murein L,D-transpeptidase YafK
MSSGRVLHPRIAGLIVRLVPLLAAAGLLSACQDTGSTGNSRAFQPISSEMLDLMAEKGTNQRAPIILRAYKKEAELEVWKMKDDGHYTLLKTYPMCRWSGQLGPKTREGDRQVPEGFYTITPGQMNPNSAYYLSFNVGYPNTYDKAHGYTGGEIMVHGVCSSAGCFSMTDAQIAEIYAIAREAFGGGQRAIQMQSLPFRMSAENLARYRLDPNMNFWKELKKGVDAFDVTQQEPQVGVCNKHYVFDATPADPRAQLDPTAACPPLKQDETLAKALQEKQVQDDAAVAEFVAKGVKPIRTVYDDGGQNPEFASRNLDVSRPDAIAQGPIDIVLDEHGKPLPSTTAVASAKPADKNPATRTSAVTTAKANPPSASAAPASASAFAPQSQPVVASQGDVPFYKKWLGLGGGQTDPAPVAVPAVEPATPQPVNVPLPPRHQAVSTSAPKLTTKPATPNETRATPSASLPPRTKTASASPTRSRTAALATTER